MKNYIIIAFLGLICPGILFSQTANLSGTLFTDNLESDVRAGGKTINIQLSLGVWASDLGEGDNASTNDLIIGFSGDQNWDKVVSALNYTHVSRISETLAQITLPQVADYYIPVNENISLIIPPSALISPLSSIPASPQIQIANETSQVVVSGAILDGTASKELDIQISGSNIILTVEGDEWDPLLGTNSSITSDLIRGISGSTSWNTDVVSTILGSDQGASNVSLSGKTVTVSIPPVSNYETIGDDNISVNVPYQILKYTPDGSISGIPELLVDDDEGSASINDPSLTESTLDGAELTLSLNDARFRDNSLNASSFEHNGPFVISIQSVRYENSRKAFLTFGLSGELESDITDFRITIDESELNGDESLTTNAIIISASPKIKDVTIPDGTYKIQDKVNVVITVADDKGKIYTYNSGTVAGKPLEGIERISATEYNGYFTVQEGDQSYKPGESIPVTNLQLAHNSNLSKLYSGTITKNITISTERKPEIKDVTIPNGTYKILDKVNVVITVADDGGNIYTYNSGTVAGKPLEGIERISATKYNGYFTVQEGDQSYIPGESIPVTNLQLADDSYLSNPYSGTITEGITIDAKRPFINYMQTDPSGIKKVGDLVSIIVSADGSLYTAVESQTKVNNVPLSSSNVGFRELGNGVYILEYQVGEGDDDVSSGNLTASLQLMDPAGNLSLIKTSLTSNTISIDSNSPKVSKITVPNGVYNTGDVIEILIQADGANYSATNNTYVNGIPLSSSSVSFGYVSGTQYRLLYTVNKEDPEVLPGEIEIVVSLRDPAGNTGQPYSIVEPNTLAIYTSLPSALLTTGNQSICAGDQAKLTVILTGRSPWKIYLTDGSTTVKYEGISSSPYEIFLTPSIATVYSIESVEDVNGTSNSGTGTSQVTVRERTPVEIINLNSTYSVESDPIQLEASIEGGTFSGPGVNSANGTFDPGVADTVNSPHTLLYTFINENNCPSVASALVFVLGATGDLFIPKNIYCNYDEVFMARATNMSEGVGKFVLVNESGEEVEGLTDNGNNTATVDPGALIPGNYTIEYEYFDEIIFILKEKFILESVEQPEILIPDREEYCQNVDPFKMKSSVAEAIFTGPGVTGNVSDGFIFDPREAYIGSNSIILSHTSPGGCSRADTLNISIAQMPDVRFLSETLCVGPSDTVFFTNTTSDKNLIENWSWDFGDPRSGERNLSTVESPWHIYNDAGARTITLIGTAESGCSDTLRQTLDFGNTPSGSFSWDNECFDEGATVTFTSEMTSVSPIISYEWTITDAEGEVTTIPDKESFIRSFGEMESYSIELLTESEAGCLGYSKRELLLKPIITPTDAVNYSENFNSGNGSWSAEAGVPSDYLSWEYDQVDFANTGSPSTNGWLTNFPDIVVYESSWVKSPCFDLSDLERPMIVLDIYRSLAKDSEGVALQATTDGGSTWQTIGELESGLNWYTSGQIDPGPGAQARGWTGNQPFAADANWTEVRHDLEAVSGEGRVQFRIALASEHSSLETNREGFAFDNVQITERSRKVLLEHFTNSSASNTREINGVINGLYNWFFADMVKLEYHTSFPGMDPFNEHNTIVPAIRGLYYGVAEVPYSVLNGGYRGELSVSYNPDSLKVNSARAERLHDGAFSIDIEVDYQSSRITADISVTALKDLEPAERIIHVAIYEKLITNIGTINGAENFLNVVKTMLPNVAGSAVFDGWTSGQTRSWQFSWDFTNVFDPDMVRVAAFIQNDDTREVYQAEALDATNLTTGMDEKKWKDHEIMMYPNPASDQLFIYFRNVEDSGDFSIELIDQLGRSVLQEKIYSYENLKEISLETLSKGVYIARIVNSMNQPVKISRIVIVK